MGQLYSFLSNYLCFNCFSYKNNHRNNHLNNRNFFGLEYLDFENLFMFFKVNRFYEDGFFEILLSHNLYGKVENIKRCLRVYGLKSIQFSEFSKLLVNYNSEGFVKIHKDRGLLLLGSVYVENRNNPGNYIELKNLLIENCSDIDKKDLEIIDTDRKDDYEHFNG